MQQSFRKLLILLFPLVLLAQEEQNALLAEVEPEVNLTSASLETDEVAFLGESIQSPPISLSGPEEGAPFAIKKTKSSSIAVLLSSLVPGLGHYYLGDIRVGNELLGSVLVGGASTYAMRKDPALWITSATMVQSIGFYSIYAAYRDTHFYNGNPPLFMPKEDYKALSAAPFQWSIIKKPEVWGAFLGSLTVAFTVAYFAYPQEACARIKTTYVEPLRALPVAVGEESLFRGFLQTSLADTLPAWGAISLSSLIFGAAHIPNAQRLEPSQRWRYYAYSLPVITGFGAYAGWLTYKNHSLKESVALHAWYDFALMSMTVLASTAAIGRETYISHSWEF